MRRRKPSRIVGSSRVLVCVNWEAVNVAREEMVVRRVR